jgi:hypothetical protein
MLVVVAAQLPTQAVAHKQLVELVAAVMEISNKPQLMEVLEQ